MKPYTIAVQYTAQDDDKKLRTRSSIQVSAEDVGKAYDTARNQLGDGYKLGACVPGHGVLY